MFAEKNGSKFPSWALALVCLERPFARFAALVKEGSQPTCGGAAPDLAQKGHRQWSDLPHRMPEVSPKRTWRFDTQGGELPFAASAKVPRQTGKSGHSSASRPKPTRYAVHRGRLCAESEVCKVTRTALSRRWPMCRMPQCSFTRPDGVDSSCSNRRRNAPYCSCY